jgi:GGDEF domain-containing protein
MAESLCPVFRDADMFSRLGGDELIVILPGTEVEIAKELNSDHIRQPMIPIVIVGSCVNFHVF